MSRFWTGSRPRASGPRRSDGCFRWRVLLIASCRRSLGSRLGVPDVVWGLAEFSRTRPFQGLTIGTGIHLEAKTVVLLLT